MPSQHPDPLQPGMDRAGGPETGDVFVYPASFAQKRLWFLEQLDPGTSQYNLPANRILRGPLNLEALRAALEEIVKRHEILRTTLRTENGQPVQVIAPTAPLAFPLVDLSHLPREKAESEVRRIVNEESWKPFRLAEGPLFRTALVRHAPEEHVLVIVFHHIVFDGWSMGVFFWELSHLYGAFSEGRASTLPDLPIQYVDYALWQQNWLQGEALERELAYWKAQLTGAPLFLDLPTDRPRSRVRSLRGSRESRMLPESLRPGLERLSRREGVTLFMTMLAGFQALLSRYTGQRDVLVGSPVAGRDRLELEQLIGFFVNTLVLRGDLSGDPTFREFLARVREMALGAYTHQDLPFERLVEEAQPDRTLSRTPLFQVMFQMGGRLDATEANWAALRVDRFRLETVTSKFDLSCSVSDSGTRLTCSIDYATDLFEPETIRRLLEQFEVMLDGIVADPDRRVSRLPLMREAQRRRVVVDWNATAVPYPRDETVHRLFERQVESSAGRVAVQFGEESLTYGELNQRSNQLAHHLRALGVRPDVPVGLCMERSLRMVVALLGILKAGGAYVPLDPAYPRERLALLLEDSRPPLVLTEQKLRERLPEGAPPTISVDTDWPGIARQSPENPGHVTGPDNLAYVIHTSGSTGKPKGVMVPHRGVVRLLVGSRYARLDSETVLLHLAPVSFDASTFEIWGALLHGGRCVVSPEKLLEARELGSLLASAGVTTAWLTASLFNLVVEEGVEALSSLEELLIGGEALSVSHVRRALERLPETRIINGYGPTESTTFACCHWIRDEGDLKRGSVPIGRPIANTRAYVLDSWGEPVPPGVRGELHLGGDGLARGYLGEPGWTAEKFVPDPFGPSPGERLYRTGDVVRYLSDGSLEFLGRTDHQVKVRGFRIELGEVAAALSRCPGVRQAVVDLEEDSGGGRSLIAYVATQSPAPTIAELRRQVGRSLPDYMIPSRFLLLDAIPLTPSGKVDRQALSVPGSLPEETVERLAPRSDVEEKLARIWSEVLDLSSVGVHDDFFSLGGHSLLAIRVFSRIRETLQVDLPLRSLFESPTIAGLASLIEEARQRSTAASPVAIPARSRDEMARHAAAGKSSGGGAPSGAGDRRTR